MYDPLVVDAFMRVQAAHARREETTEQLPASKANVSGVGSALGRELRVGTQVLEIDGLSALNELSRRIGGRRGLRDTAEVITKHLRQVSASSLCVLFLHQPESDDIVAIDASGVGEDSIRGLAVRVGAGVAGWAAANRRVATGADARLEFGGIEEPLLSSLVQTHAYPLLADEVLVGVVSVCYTSDLPPSDDRLRALTSLVPQVSRILDHALELDRQQDAHTRDALSTLPSFAAASHWIALPPSAPSSVSSVCVVFLEVDHVPTIDHKSGRGAGDELLLNVARAIRQSLRAKDLLFRYGRSEFIALLPESEPATAEGVATRLVSSVTASPILLRDGTTLALELSAGFAVAPRDGNSLDELASTAKRRAVSQRYRTESAAIH